MATTIYLTNNASDVTAGGGGVEEVEARVAVRGASVGTGTTDTTVAGFGLPLTRDTTSDIELWWYTPPLNAVTISGTLTVNFWMSESNMAANVSAAVGVARCGPTGTFIEGITNETGTGTGVELPIGTRAAQNWTTSPATVSLAAGDRIRIKMIGDGVVAMAGGQTFNGSFGATSASVDGDSWVQFTETITEQSGATSTSPPFPGSRAMRGLTPTPRARKGR